MPVSEATLQRPKRQKSVLAVALGQAVRSVRVERGYSQEGFAAHAGIDGGYYGAIERGGFNISVSTIARLADGLETRPSVLFVRAENAA